MSENPATSYDSSFPRRRESLFAFVATRSKSDSRLRGNDDSTFFFLRTLVLLALLVMPTLCIAQVSDPTPLQFEGTTQETRFHRLTAELRCVMCQNQSLADSNAQIAHDLRREVLALMQQGKSDAEIKRFLVERYGEFVLYKPQVSGDTWLLWFGPALLLLAGAGIVLRIVRKRGDVAVVADDRQEW
jgi:cytochrome c-type biogenesis protein CcmH